MGFRKSLGTDAQGRRYWGLGPLAGAWRVYVQGADGSQWGWYDGEHLALQAAIMPDTSWGDEAGAAAYSRVPVTALCPPGSLATACLPSPAVSLHLQTCRGCCWSRVSLAECGMTLAGPAIAELLTWLRAGQVPQEQPLISVLARAPLPRRSDGPTQQPPIAGEMPRKL